jgi:uncharacterized protein (DUF1330 family)
MEIMLRGLFGALLAAAPAMAEPPAYVVAELVPTDAVVYQRDYVPGVTAVVAAHGGRYLARGGEVEALSGATPAARIVIIAFPSMAAVRAFWASPEYQALAQVRSRSATGRIYAVEGLAEPSAR